VRNLFSILFFVTAAAFAAAPVPTPLQFEFFEKQVRPLLVERCYECHAEKKQKGGLRLDSAAAVLKGGDSGPALVPGHPDQSKIIEGISWSDPDFQMPPKNKLAESEIAVLSKWIETGAADPRTNAEPAAPKVGSAENSLHWAYQPLSDAPPPKPKNTAWARNAVDHFILAKLEAKNIQPAPDAEPASLVRRAYYDLTGLPPTPEEINVFSGSDPRKSFPELVDRLLASPRFGERWGRHWLDVARYGESVTLRGLIFKDAWRYRDYVISVFNEDVPYDQFIREQISGDLLSSQDVALRQRQVVATTFLVLGNTNFEEQDKAQLRMDVVDEQLDTIGKAFLAQTFGCARCHDHKFDPIPARDYYAMAGILRNAQTLIDANVSTWVTVPLPLVPDEEKIYAEQEAKVAAVETEIKAAKETVRRLAGVSGETKSAGSRQIIQPEALPGIVVDSAQAKAVGHWMHSQFSKNYIGDGYLHDENSGKGEKTLTFIPEIKVAGKYEVRLAYVHSQNRSTNVPVTISHADGETTVHVNQQESPVLDGRFVSLGQFRFEKSGFASVLVANEGTTGHVIADAVQFFPLDSADGAPKRAKSKSAPNGPQQAAADEVKSLEARLKKLRDSGPKRPEVMSVREQAEIGDTQINIRGNVHNKGPTVPRGFLQVATVGPVPAIPDNQSGRRELADWIASSQNPLTARVMVNRVWHWLLGSGLVRTPDNFGKMGETPSHPELLDYLASCFIEDDWSVKKLIREIMLSHTYQLAGATADKTGSSAAADPENRLFGHANLRRLDAESIRDTILFVSGDLKLDMGGRTFDEGMASDFAFNSTEPRRSVYLPVFRNALPEVFEVFDFADPSMVTGVRNVSTVAPQALFLMNHPWVREQSRRTAQRLLASPATNDRDRVGRLYQMTVGRAPNAKEISIAMKNLAGEPDATEAWAQLVQAVFASIDFRYLN